MKTFVEILTFWGGGTLIIIYTWLSVKSLRRELNNLDRNPKAE